MDLHSYVRFLRRNWEVVVAFTLIGITVAMGFVLFTTPKFSATSELFLTTPGYSSLGSLATNESSPYQADAFSQQRARSYVQLAYRVDLARRVTERLKLNMKPEDLVAATSASVQPDTVLMDVTVESNAPTQAKVLADAVTAELANDIRTLEVPAGILIPNVDPVVIQPALTPQKPSKPNIAIYLIFGASGGFLAGVTAATSLRRTRAIRGPQVIEQITGRPVLGTVRPEGDEAGSLAEWKAIQRKVEFEVSGPDNRNWHNAAFDRVIAVASAAAGDHSSAAAAGELAAAFARTGSRSVLVAIDAHGFPFVVTRQSPSVGLAGVLAGEAPLAEAIQSTKDARLKYLTGPGPDNPIPLLQSEKFRDLVNELRDSFDLVIFHSPDFLRQAGSTLLKDIVDSVILTATDETTQRRHLSAAVRLLGNWNVELVGTILVSGFRAAGSDKDRRTLVALGRTEA